MKIKQEKEEIKKEISKSIKDTFNFEKLKETKIDPIEISFFISSFSWFISDV